MDDGERITYGGIPFEDIQMSEKTTDLMQAWIKAKIELGSVVKKEGVNPHFRSKYATLDATLQRGEPVLARHGLGILQMPTDNRLVNLLFHESGQWISFRYRMAPVKNDPQALGSALTYSRRYCFQSITMLSGGDDDDGEAAMAKDEKESAQKSAQAPPPKSALLETEEYPEPKPKPKPKPRKKAYTGVASILAEAEEYDFKNPPPPDPNLIDKPSATESLPSGQQEEKYLKSEYEPTHQIKLFITAINSCKDLRDLTKTKNQIRVQNFQGRDRDYLLHHFALKESELSNG